MLPLLPLIAAATAAAAITKSYLSCFVGYASHQHKPKPHTPALPGLGSTQRPGESHWISRHGSANRPPETNKHSDAAHSRMAHNRPGWPALPALLLRRHGLGVRCGAAAAAAAAEAGTGWGRTNKVQWLSKNVGDHEVRMQLDLWPGRLFALMCILS